MSSSSPSRRTVSAGLPMPSVERLAADFDNVLNFGSPGQPKFVGGFVDLTERGTARESTIQRDKPLPATPPNARVASESAVPVSLQPGGRQHREHRGAACSSPATTPFSLPFDTSPISIPMPVPSIASPFGDQSLTMTYARSAPPTSSDYTFSAQMPEPDNGQSSSYFSQTLVSTPAARHAQIVTRTRASSTPPSPASATSSTTPASTVQCSGTTKAGQRCTRVVKGPPPLSFFAPESSEPVQRFCFQHVKEILAQSGFYSHKEGGGWVEFGDWIPGYLHGDTQAALRIEMEKPASKADEPGYIYAYEIRDDTEPKEFRIKVGRAVKLVKRLDQWSKQCTSKEVILRGWWPGKVEDEAGDNDASLLRGKVIAGERGPCCHRLERLVHLELADLAVHAPYLETGFPKTVWKPKDTKPNGTSSTPSTPGRSPKPSRARVPGGQPCKDCGAMHKEIFTLQRAPKGVYKDMEWERLVKPVIERWGSFVGQYV